MGKNHCIDCRRFDRPKDGKGPGFCTQCGEDTSADGDACHWFAPRGKTHEEKEN